MGDEQGEIDEAVEGDKAEHQADLPRLVEVDHIQELLLLYPVRPGRQ